MTKKSQFYIRGFLDIFSLERYYLYGAVMGFFGADGSMMTFSCSCWKTQSLILSISISSIFLRHGV
ncbi:hypothetical protein BTK64_20020 [Cronobacter sakazakii]|nr:hypothetical protein BTK64_20020 [Cronobacter sakazakii]